ncbi:IS256 family transposase [Dermatophilaceae bacterium Soc4.6]
MQAEVAAYVDAFADQGDEHGRRLVVPNGYHAAREVTTAAGAVRVKAPRVNDRRVDESAGSRARFSSAILPAWARKSPRVAEVLPLLYLHGLSSNDFGPALEQFLGSKAGLSGPTITRLTTQWQDGAAVFGTRFLAGTDYVYMWVDGFHLKVRLSPDNVCLLVIIGVRVDGTKELIALADGHRESSESWADLLRDCQRRGMTAPVLAAGDGALGFWNALRDVFPTTREQRCWFHQIANVLNALPKSAQPGAKAALAEIWQAEDREHTARVAAVFGPSTARSGPRRPRRSPTTSTCSCRSMTTRPSTGSICRPRTRSSRLFATLRLRQRVTKGPGSRAAGIAMAFKLIESAQARWRTVNAPHMVALVRAGAMFEKGELIERLEESAPD